MVGACDVVFAAWHSPMIGMCDAVFSAWHSAMLGTCDAVFLAWHCMIMGTCGDSLTWHSLMMGTCDGVSLAWDCMMMGTCGGVVCLLNQARTSVVRLSQFFRYVCGTCTALPCVVLQCWRPCVKGIILPASSSALKHVAVHWCRPAPDPQHGIKEEGCKGRESF